MPTLNWIGKEAVVKHHKDVPFRLLEPMPELSLPAGNCGGFQCCRLTAEPPFDAPPGPAGPKLSYAAANRMEGRAARQGTSFRQTSVRRRCRR